MTIGMLSEVFSNDARLTNMSLLHSNPNLIAHEAVPVQPAALPNGKYYVYDRSHQHLLGDAKRAPGALPHTIETGYTTQAYNAYEYALEDKIAKENVDFADGALNPLDDAAMLLTEAIKIQIERDLATNIDATTDFATSHSTTKSGTGQWSDYTNSTPLTDLETAREQVRTYMGVYPNVCIMGAGVWSKLQFHPDVKSANSNSVIGNRAGLSEFSQLIQVDRTYVGTGVYVSSNVGQTDTTADIWGKHCWLLYIPNGMALRQQAFGWHFQRPLAGTGGLRQVVQTREDTFNYYVCVRIASGFNTVSQVSSKAAAGYVIVDAVA